MKFKITATLPIGQYANIMPEIEVEAETYEEAKNEAMGKLQDIANEYSTVPLGSTKVAGVSRLVDCFVGGQIEYDDLNHIYTWKGEKYLSGSEYAKQGSKPFDSDLIAGAMAKRDGGNKEYIQAMWALNSEASKQFGLSVHSALEAFARYKSISKQPILKNITESFYKTHEEDSESEIFIVDHAKKWAGQVDRLEILGDKHCRVTDFKTNAEIEKSLPSYWKQLDFYTQIMQAGGWKCGPPVIYWLNNGVWETINKEHSSNKEEK